MYFSYFYLFKMYFVWKKRYLRRSLLLSTPATKVKSLQVLIIASSQNLNWEPVDRVLGVGETNRSQEWQEISWGRNPSGHHAGYNSEIYKKCSMLQILCWEHFGNFQTSYLSDYPWTATSALNRQEQPPEVFSKTSQNSLENTCARACFL